MSRNNSLVEGQPVAHGHAGRGTIVPHDDSTVPAKTWALVRLEDGSYEYWKVKQIRVKVGI